MSVLSTFGDDGAVFQLGNLNLGGIKLYIEAFHTEAWTSNAICLCVESCNTMLLSFAWLQQQV